MNYYNDNDPKVAAWLRELIKQNVIPMGDVDERSIKDVTGSDLKGYTQIHMFAGIGGWAEALRLAGWPANRPVWTGSCPCQPFSCAGKRQGEKDGRHLWPEFRRLIAECNPPIVFGEQVASKDGRLWLSGVRSDLEKLGYAVGAADLCAAGIGAPHIRQRLYWVADTAGRQCGQQHGPQRDMLQRPSNDGSISGMADSDGKQIFSTNTGGFYPKSCSSSEPGGVEYPTGDGRDTRRTESDGGIASGGCGFGGVGNSSSNGSQTGLSEPEQRQKRITGIIDNTSRKLSFWSRSIWLPCADGKARRTKPEIFPLVDGLPGRVGLLRGSGNAIIPEIAAEFIKAYMDIEEYRHD